MLDKPSIRNQWSKGKRVREVSDRKEVREMDEETKRRIEMIRREIQEEIRLLDEMVNPDLLRVKLNRFNSIVHPRPEVTGW